MPILSASRARRCDKFGLATQLIFPGRDRMEAAFSYQDSTIMIKSIGIAVMVVAAAFAADMSSPRIRAHVKFLSSDLLEGRGVGARGGDVATEYIATEFALAGLKPAGDNGT